MEETDILIIASEIYLAVFLCMKIRLSRKDSIEISCIVRQEVFNDKNSFTFNKRNYSKNF